MPRPGAPPLAGHEPPFMLGVNTPPPAMTLAGGGVENGGVGL